MPRRVLPLAVGAVLVAVLGACKGAGEREPAAPGPATPIEFDEVEYHFQDASVPPPHHRSVTITAKVGSILRVVDSYGDEIERQQGQLDEAQFAELVDAFAEAGVRPLDAGVGNAGCTGGTSESVRLSRRGEAVFSGTIDHCGGSDAADFQGDLRPFITALKSRAGRGPVSD